MVNLINDITLNISSITMKRGDLMKAELKSLKHNYKFSDLHTIDYIGKNELANVTRIAAYLGLTRGAVSKIVKRLIKNKHVVSYMQEGNRKEVYYNLTDEGRVIFREHDEIHREFDRVESEFFGRFDRSRLEDMNAILTEYNTYLTNKKNDIK